MTHRPGPVGKTGYLMTHYARLGAGEGPMTIASTPSATVA